MPRRAVRETRTRPGGRWRPSGVGYLEGGEVAGGAAELDADEVDRLAGGAVLVGVATLQAPCPTPRHKPQRQEIKQVTITIRGAQFPAALPPISPLPGYQVHHSDQLQLFG